MHLVPLVDNKAITIKPAIEEVFKKIGCKLRIVYTDDAGEFKNKVDFGSFFKDHDILHMVTTEHARSAERAIRTLKMMMEKRLELQKQEGKSKHNWFNMLPSILDVYNNQAVHRSIQMSPVEGRMKRITQLFQPISN